MWPYRFPAEIWKVRGSVRHPAPHGALGRKEAMTYRERELETIRRLRAELDKRQITERSHPISRPGEEAQVQSDEQAEVLFELICL